MEINIKLNGKVQQVNKHLRLNELLTESNVKQPEMVTVQVNGAFVKRDEFDSTVISENDEVDFVYFMGGGSKLN